MLEILQFIFQDFTHWLGSAFMLALICYAVSSWFRVSL